MACWSGVPVRPGKRGPARRSPNERCSRQGCFGSSLRSPLMSRLAAALRREITMRIDPRGAIRVLAPAILLALVLAGQPIEAGAQHLPERRFSAALPDSAEWPELRA